MTLELSKNIYTKDVLSEAFEGVSIQENEENFIIDVTLLSAEDKERVNNLFVNSVIQRFQ